MQTLNSKPVTIKIHDKLFDVFSDGTVHQERCSSGVELDEARLQAAPIFCQEARSRGLGKTQHLYWAGVGLKTDIRNFTSPQQARV